MPARPPALPQANPEVPTHIFLRFLLTSQDVLQVFATLHVMILDQDLELRGHGDHELLQHQLVQNLFHGVQVRPQPQTAELGELPQIPDRV